MSVEEPMDVFAEALAKGIETEVHGLVMCVTKNHCALYDCTVRISYTHCSLMNDYLYIDLEHALILSINCFVVSCLAFYFV